MGAASQNKKNPFVNKQPGVQREKEFWEDERWLAVSDWEAIILNNIFYIFI